MIKGSYQEAVKHFEERDYQSAQMILLSLVEKQPENLDILYFLAVLKSKIGEFNSAIPIFKKVIELKSNHTEAYYNLALCLHNLGKHEEALKYYQKALNLNPFLSEAYNNIAIVYKSLKKYEEAEKAFEKAVKVKPQNSNAVSNLSGLSLEKSNSKEYNHAVQLYREGKYDKAKIIILDLLDKNPDNLQLLTSLAIISFNTKDYENAIKFYSEILERNNNRPDANYGLAVCYQNSENYELAFKYYKKAIELKPDYVESLNNLGLLYSELKNNGEAIKCYELALKYNPEYSNALINLGGIKLNRDDFDGAIVLFNKALNQLLKNGGSVENISMTYTNIGVVYFRNRNIEKAVKYFNKGIELNPENLVAHYNKAEALLIIEQFEEGWKEYEWRKDRKDFGKRKFNKLLMPGVDIEGKEVLVFAEQGLGDALHFLRYIPMLKKKGCRIIFECGKEMHPLLRNFKWIDEILERDINNAPDIKYDYEIPLLSLPKFFNTNNMNIPAEVPYLNADTMLKEKWAKFLQGSDKIKIGIVWAGNPKHTNDRHRSVLLKQFMPLLSIGDTHFYSLQKGFPVIQVKDYQLLLTDLDDYLISFADTAAVIENLDLVITVDTSVAHLAGALGKETWVLIPYMPDWRWLLNGEKSKWYPSMKLYRQPAFGDWSSVFLDLKEDLIKLVNNKKKESTILNSAAGEDSVSKNSKGLQSSKRETIYLGLTSGENFGWGVCSKYLKKELSQKLNIINLDESSELVKEGKVNGPVFHALNNNDFKGIYPARGTINIGYTFFEYELSDLALSNSVNYELILGGSSWNEQKLKEKGVENTGVLIQGVDPDLFYPGETEKKQDLFVIFSGGKFELRKGQDMVLKAVKILQEKYHDVVLINAWYNMWPNTMQSMNLSKHIKFQYKGETWKNFMINLCGINGIDGNKILTLPVTPNNKLRELYLKSDIGLFPNRCEGGTNLVLMEYMACGKPVVASYNSGHKDILTKENSFRLEKMHDFKLFNENKKLIADWEEPDLDEIVANLEYAYFNRSEIKQIGKNAAEFMKKFTWKQSAETLLKYFKL